MMAFARFWAMPEETSGQERPGEDDLDRRLRELTAEVMGEARFKEPSAADRAKRAARDRKRDKRQQRRQRRQGHRVALTAGAIAVVVLAAGGAITWMHMSHSGTSNPPIKSAPRGLVSGDGPPADPFATTKAEHWADGASGIVIPAAKPVGHFTAAQVAQAYQTTKQMVIAGNLDKQTLLGGAPTAYAGFLTKQQRSEFLSGLNKTGLDKRGYELSTRVWVASFFPGSAHFIGSVIKVHGTMSARTVHESGTTALSIQVNYLFVYPVDPPANPSEWMRVVDHESGSVDFAQWDDPGGQLEPWDGTDTSNAGGQCGTKDGYIHPAYSDQSGPEPSASGRPVDPYSMATSAPSTGKAVCSETTGT